MNYVWLILAVATVPAGSLFFKAGTLRVGQSPQNLSRMLRFLLRAFSNPFVVSGVVFTILSIVSYAFAASIFPLAYVFSLVNAVPVVLTVVISLLLFKDKVSRLNWLGIATVCVGVVLVSCQVIK